MNSDISCWILTIGLISHVLNMVEANWDKVCPPYKRRPHPAGVCGSRIDELLSTLCMDGYNEYPTYDFWRRKREANEEDDTTKLSRILIKRGEANSFLSKRSNYYGQGIVCECCYNQCTVGELFLYCRGTPGSFMGLFKRSTDRQKKKIDTDFNKYFIGS